VVLTVEMPTESLDYAAFADGLDALSYYADKHYLDALNLARIRLRARRSDEWSRLAGETAVVAALIELGSTGAEKRRSARPLAITGRSKHVREAQFRHDR